LRLSIPGRKAGVMKKAAKYGAAIIATTYPDPALFKMMSGMSI
jgi:hypothetical protein